MLKSVKKWIYDRKVRRIIKDNMPGDFKRIYKIYKGYRDTDGKYKYRYINLLRHKDRVKLVEVNKLIKQLR